MSSKREKRLLVSIRNGFISISKAEVPVDFLAGGLVWSFKNELRRGYGFFFSPAKAGWPTNFGKERGVAKRFHKVIELINWDSRNSIGTKIIDPTRVHARIDLGVHSIPHKTP